MTIDEFIETVYPKIKHRISKTEDTIMGAELMLTGVKNVKGEEIDPDKVYKMEVPVIIHQDHKRKLRLAWLRGGKNSVREYLSEYLDAKVLDVVMSVL
jgi:fructose/tagatose bisphosphate aldolase